MGRSLRTLSKSATTDVAANIAKPPPTTYNILVRCPCGRIGKPVPIRRVPNAVRGMARQMPPGDREGGERQANPSQKTGRTR